MLTKIPYFKEVLISSFQCEECGYKNSEIQPAGELSPYGYKYILKMIRRSDLDRDIIFSEHANIKFLELELEIPCNKGSINTIEGLLRKAYDGMIEGQD
jgi:zinc finger protein